VAGDGEDGAWAGHAQGRYRVQHARGAAGGCNGEGLRDARDGAALYATGADLFGCGIDAGVGESYGDGWTGELFFLCGAGAIRD